MVCLSNKTSACKIVSLLFLQEVLKAVIQINIKDHSAKEVPLCATGR